MGLDTIEIIGDNGKRKGKTHQYFMNIRFIMDYIWKVICSMFISCQNDNYFWFISPLSCKDNTIIIESYRWNINFCLAFHLSCCLSTRTSSRIHACVLAIMTKTGAIKGFGLSNQAWHHFRLASRHDAVSCHVPFRCASMCDRQNSHGSLVHIILTFQLRQKRK